MKRKEPKECPLCKSKQFSYETDSVTIESSDKGGDSDIVIQESEWTCLECDEIFYHRAWYELGSLIEESTTT